MKYQAIHDLLERIIGQDKTPDAGDFAEVMDLASDAIDEFNTIEGVEEIDAG